MDSHELSEWMAYDRIEPIGAVRIDMAGAIIASTIANVNRGKGQKAYKITDFMPYIDKNNGKEELVVDKDGLSIPDEESLKSAFALLMKTAKKKEK